MTTDIIDRLYLELSQITTAYNERELKMLNWLYEIEFDGRPHGSNITYPDGCECHECERYDAIKKFLSQFPDWVGDIKI